MHFGLRHHQKLMKCINFKIKKYIFGIERVEMQWFYQYNVYS